MEAFKMIFLLWFIRLVAGVGMLLTILWADVNSIATGFFFVIGLLAALNIYMHVVIYEINQSMPSLWIFFRTVQALIVWRTENLPWEVFLIFLGIDFLLMFLYWYDRKYSFILVDEENKVKKTRILRSETKKKKSGNKKSTNKKPGRKAR